MMVLFTYGIGCEVVCAREIERRRQGVRDVWRGVRERED